MAELIRRRSRMVLVRASMLMPVQPTCRIKLRRGMMIDGACGFIGLSLDGEVGAGEDQMDDGPDTVTLVGVARRAAIGVGKETYLGIGQIDAGCAHAIHWN